MNAGTAILFLAASLYIIAPATAAESHVDQFARHALAEWVLLGETLPASPATCSALLQDLPAAIRLARTVTGLDYKLVPLDTGGYTLFTPRGLTAFVKPTLLDRKSSEGVFEAMGAGVFVRPASTFRGSYAMRFRYRQTPDGVVLGDFYVYLDVESRILRFLGLLVRGLVQDRLAEEMRRMLAEAKQVMTAANR